MNNLTKEEAQLLAILRDLKSFEMIEIKKDTDGNLVYTYTRKERHILLQSIEQ